MIDYLSAEFLIIERLENTISGIKILSTAELASVSDRSQITPAIHVIYAGDKVESEGGQMRSHIFIRQKWLVVLAVRDIRDIRNGATKNSMAGEILLQMHTFLAGYQLSKDHGFLRREPGPSPRYLKNFVRFPLMFSTKIEMKGFLN